MLALCYWICFSSINKFICALLELPPTFAGLQQFLLVGAWEHSLNMALIDGLTYT